MSAGWLPNRSQAVDLAFLTLATLCGLFGFGRAYGGDLYLVVGAIGVLLGALVAFTADRLKAPVVTLAAVTVAVFFLLGNPIALQGPAGALPTLTAVRDLADGAVRGWSQLLTVLPPAGRTGDLMAIPYLLGLVGTVAGYAVARRTTRSWPPALVPALVLGLSILFGTDQPSSLLVQGAAFAVLTIGWTAARAHRGRVVLSRGIRRRRLAGATALLAVALGGGLVLGPHLPLAQANPRLVLRDHVDPPFDPRAYPSPLGEFRRFALPGTGRLKDSLLFSMDGLPAGALIRIATMDDYDGTVWNVAGTVGASSGGSGSGYFQRVGETIPTTVTGTRADLAVTMGALGSVWLPDSGVVTSVRFDGVSAAELTDTFRYNRATDTAVTGTRPAGSSRGLQPGDHYQLSVVVPPTDVMPVGTPEATLSAAGPLAVALPDLGLVMDPVKTAASQLVGDAVTPYARARAIEKALTNGYLSDGGQGQQPSDAGHYAARLTDMLVAPDTLIGDAEQYAALMAVMLRELDIPARVVLGVKPPTGTSGHVEVHGRDITAWVEVGLQGVGWVPMFPTPDSDQKKPQVQPQPKQNPQVKEPPKVVTPPKADTDVLGTGTDQAPTTRPSQAGSGLVRVLLITASAISAPVLVLAAATGLLIAVKARRRRRRRRQGRPSTRIAAGWREYVDLAVDAGASVPARGTRREIAGLLGQPAAGRLAGYADHAVFGPGEPTEDQVRAYWADVETARTTWGRSLGVVGRWKAAVNPSSLWQEPPVSPGRRRGRRLFRSGPAA